MMRPRESFDQRLVDAKLEIDPPPISLRWIHDVFGNSLALARFEGRSDRLTVSSTTQLDPDRIVDGWAHNFVARNGTTETVALLGNMAATIRRNFTYVARHAKGTQTPIETLALRQGSCRDFAVLMIEAVRALGFAARFVSGYVYDPSPGEGLVGGGNTHAWVRVFLPGSGWVEFDPTNGIIGNRGLIRVAVARDPYQAIPLSGTWAGFPGSYRGMDIEVDIRMAASADELPASARIQPPSQIVQASNKRDMPC